MRFAYGPQARAAMREAKVLGADLRHIFGHAVRYDPMRGNISAGHRTVNPNWNTIDYALGRSNTADMVRKNLPEKLGGYTDEFKELLVQAAESDPDIASKTYLKGQPPPTLDNRYVPQWQKPVRAGAEIAGVMAGDMSKAGLQNLWWLINAPQAVAMVGSQASLGNIGGEKLAPRLPDSYRQSAIRGQGPSMQATLPATIAMGVGIGALTRLPGYQAVYPDDEDKRKTTDPVGEAFSRFFRGPRGRLLPYNEGFSEERPDVSFDQYKDYKAYLRDRQLVKGTMDGIHGPEINFLGASIPLLTGIIPVAGAIAGTRLGAGRRLRQLANAPREMVTVGKAGRHYNDPVGKRQLKDTPLNPLEQMEALRDEHRRTVGVMERMDRDLRDERHRKGVDRPVTINDTRGHTAHRYGSDDPKNQYNLMREVELLATQLHDMEKTVDRSLLKHAMVGGFTGLTATGTAGYGLELLRRQIRGQDNENET